MNTDLKKIKKNTIIIVIALLLIPNIGNAQINVNKLKNVAKDKVIPAQKNQNDDINKEEKQEENKQEENKTKEIQKEEKLPELVIDKPIYVAYEEFFKKLVLDPISGDLKLDKANFKNLPDASFGTRSDEHKLVGLLILNGKVVCEFPFKGNSRASENWSILDQRTDDWQSALYKVEQAGNYSIEFQIDGEKVDEIKFDIVQVINENNVSGLFINQPINDLGIVSANSISFGKPDPNSYFVFKFYDSELNPEASGFVNWPISVRLMKVNSDGKEEYLGGYLNKEFDHQKWNHTWKLSDNIFFKKPESSSDLQYSEIIANTGSYYVDLFLNGDRYKYKFDVNYGQLESNLSDRSTNGQVYIEREIVSMPKYENYRATLSTAGIQNNVSMTVTSKDESSSVGAGAGKPVSFTDGQKIFANLYLDENIKKEFMYQPVEFITTLKKGGEIIAQHIINELFIGGPNFSTLTSDGKFVIKNNFTTHVFMKAMAELPAGNHNLTLVYEIASTEKTKLVGVQNIAFISTGNNPIYTKWAAKTEERVNMSESELANAFFLSSASNDWVYYENNCGRIVWLRQDEYDEYYLYPGDMGKFDRFKGTLEQWNFGTLKWNSVNDFISYKTIYKLSQNDIAILYMKQVPNASNLKEIADLEFSSHDEFLNKVGSIIGIENLEEHKDIIVEQGSYDFVKICN